MPPNESITYITHNFKINLFKSFAITPYIENGDIDISAYTDIAENIDFDS